MEGLRTAIVTDIDPGERSRYWIEALSELRSRGLQPHLITVREEGALHREAAPHSAGRLALAARTSRAYPLSALKLRHYIRANGIDIVHSSEPIPGLIAAMARTPGTGAKGWLFHRRHLSTNRKQVAFTRIASARADRVLTISRSVTEAARAGGLGDEKLREVGNGVVAMVESSPELQAQDRDALNIPADAVVVVCVGRFRPDKGHEILIEACERLAAKGDGPLATRPLHLVLVGDGPRLEAVRELGARARGVVCHFPGWSDSSERWLSMGDVVAVPSLEEPFGKVAVEAMACRRPLVASRVGGLMDLLEDGRTGIGVRPGDPNELAAAILRVLTEKDRTARMVDAAEDAYSSRYTVSHMIESWLAVYDELA
jgi:glycosyltransferase involved in cell wall biosynthesis